ncbi:LPS export ABC transporter permease LptF [Defluviimonas sp. WL0002]|uniref:LPS export ABC transporter permease LptF n=1 Tax=Albidovulum marisflavi TaxID=2984159 RepID=A0ABT2ZHA0_9RHOB|nr:LPS export ABC transporter permease LptF [Defluviimonas sp. WL0002]MCV2870510.1 LPS export ABC transporter permease LptF [Defluviimonas sp. WL0002]
MSRFDRYMLSQLMMLFGFFALVLVAVYWVNRAVRLFDRLIADGQSAWTFLEFTALTLPYVIRIVLPIAAFIAAVYATNRLTSESELVVMRATGFSPFRMARPVFYFGFSVALLMAILVHVLVPASRTQLANRNDDIAANVSARLLSEGTFVHPGAGVTFYVREITPQGELRQIFLSDSRQAKSGAAARGTSTTYTAQRALIVRSDTGPKLVMFDGMAQLYEADSGRLTVTRFSDFSFDIGALVSRSRGRAIQIEELSTPALLAASEQTQAQVGESRAVLLFEGHERLAQPLLALVAAILGFSALMMGEFSRLGLWRQIIAATVCLIGVQLLVNVATGFGRSNAALWPLAYLPALAGLGVALAMLAYAGKTRRVRQETGAAA